MNIKYLMKLLKNSQHPNQSSVYYPQAQIRERINFYCIICGVGYALSLIEGGILNILQTLIVKIKERLVDVDKVNFGEFDIKKFQIQGKGSLILNGFNYKTSNLRVKFQFRPGRCVMETNENLGYKYIIPVKAKEKVKREEKEKLKQAISKEHP